MKQLDKITSLDIWLLTLTCLVGIVVCFFGFVWVFLLAGLLVDFIYLVSRRKRKLAV